MSFGTVILRLALIVFLAEGAIMLALEQVQLPNGVAVLVDALLLTAITALAGVAFILKPLKNARREEELRLIDELKASEEKFRAICATAQDAIIAADDNGTIIYWNEAAERLFGYSHDEIVGKEKVPIIMPERYRGPFQGGFQHFRSTGTGDAVGVVREFMGLRRDGTEFPVEHSLSAIQIGGRWFAMGMMRDISERKLAEESLKRNEQRYRAIADYSYDWQFWLGEDGSPLWTNSAVERLAGYSEDDCMGMENYPLPLVHEDDRPTIKGHLETARKGNFENDITFRLLCKNGSVKWVSASYQPIFDDAESLMGSRWSVRDVTLRVETEERLARNLTQQSVLNEILRISNQPLGLDAILQQALDLVVTVPFLSLDTRGGVFLVEEPGTLTMKVQRGIGPEILTSCKNIPFGHCHCGRAAETARSVFSNHIDEGHEVTYEGMKPHGHYCVPIMSGETVRGVLNIYVTEGHKWSEEEEDFLRAVAHVLAGIIDRKMAECEVLESEATVRAVVDTALDSIVTMDHEGDIVEFNPAAESVFGYTREEAIGQPLADLIIPEKFRKEHSEGLKRFLKTREQKVMGKRLELSAVRKDGTEFPVELSITLVPRENAPPMFTGYLRDITARVTAQEAIARLARYNELILDSAGEGIYGLDTEGRTTFVNPAAARMTGWKEVELVGHKLHDIIHHTKPDGSPYPAEECPNYASFKDGMVHEVKDEVFWRKDGSSFPVAYFSTPIREDDGELVGAVVVFRDITERLEAEAQLRRERDFTSSAINSLPGIFYLIGEDGRFVLWNQNFEKVTGYSGEEIEALMPIDLFGEDEREMVSSRLQAVYEEGEADAEAHLTAKDGSRIPYHFTGRRCDMGLGPCIIGMGVDITERKEMEEALRNSNQELEQFAYVASHDLQEPLRMVTSYNQLLVKRYGDQLDDEAREFVGFAVDGAQRMQRMIRDLLEYSRVETRGSPFASTDLNTVIEEATGNLWARITDTDADVTYGKLPVLMADHSQMVRLFQNLIGNALKYSDPERPPKVRIEAHQDQDSWVFSFTDNGIGIEEEYFERIFMIFQRLHGRKEFEGTGIGLAVCKKIVERHGGTIDVDSVPGQGSTFSVTLPEHQG